MSKRCDDCGRSFNLDPLHFDCFDDERQWGRFAEWAFSTELTSQVLGRGVHLGLVSSNRGAVV